MLNSEASLTAAIMLNTRIEIDTKSSPYKIHRQRPAFLDPYFAADKNSWFIFCERIDSLLAQQLEEIKAAWLVLGVVCTILLLGLIVGIVVSFVVVDDKETLGIAAGCLFAGLVVVFGGYFFLMSRWVLRPLDAFAQSVDEYCAGVSEKNGNKIHICDSDFKVWIDVSTSEAIDLTK